MKKLGFGTMRLPQLDANDPASIDIEQYKKMVDIFLSKGFTYFDTAYPYHKGESERALKTALVERYPRDSFTVTTKLPPGEIHSPEDPDRIFNEQLEKTGLEYFDYYWLHCIMQSNYEAVFEKNDCFNWLVNKKKEGKVKHIGFSFHDSADLLDRVLTEHPEIEFVQLQINYLDWESYDVQSHKCYDVCVKHGKPVIVMEPVKGGALAQLSEATEKIFKDADKDASVASWAIRFVASLDNVCMVLSGMSNIEQMEDNTSFMDNFVPLTEEECGLCLKAADQINAERPINCTGCSYCTDGCPMEIKIPNYFKMYNRFKQATSEGTIMRARDSYKEYISSHAAPSECVECGQCEDACPQHLTIRDYLKDVTAAFEG